MVMGVHSQISIISISILVAKEIPHPLVSTGPDPYPRKSCILVLYQYLLYWASMYLESV